jgi:NAD(P)-dependent dehydrogenase (short-subunit alcohol dehydrogenase family)
MARLFRQNFVSLPYPTQTFADKTVIVTGSNTGLGKEAARHIARLGAAKLILAVRSLEKGEVAKADIEQTTGCSKDVVQVWHLDMASYSSVLKFAERAERDLEKVDVLLANAAIATGQFILAEGNESTLTVNVVSTLLLVLAMLPKMKATAQKSASTPIISITSSGAHAGADFAERSAPEGKLFATMNEGKDFDAMQRYPLSKLLEVFCVKHIGEHHPNMPVTINEVNPGFCRS